MVALEKRNEKIGNEVMEGDPEYNRESWSKKIKKERWKWTGKLGSLDVSTRQGWQAKRFYGLGLYKVA